LKEPEILTLYQILGVTPEAPVETIRGAYRKGALIHHPDRNNNSIESQSAFLILGNAYRILSDEEARRDYDNYLKTSRAVRKESRAARPDTDSLDYFRSQLNFVLWEIEDLILFLKKSGEDRIVSGKTLRLWLLEILVFMDRWILEPTGHSNPFSGTGSLSTLYVKSEDYFYDIRKRMNRFIDGSRLGDLTRRTGDHDQKVIDNIIEALILSYHYLGGINAVLKGQSESITRFKHANKIYDPGQAGLLPQSS
jgi:curved DNA-binding protein CbpA